MAEKLFIQWCQVLPTYPVTSHLLKVTYSKWLKVPEKVSCYKVYFLTEIFLFSRQKPANAILLKFKWDIFQLFSKNMNFLKDSSFQNGFWWFCLTGSNDAARLVLWYKDSDPQPVYSFDNRYTKPKHWSQDPNFGSKAFFRHSVEPAQMIISSVTLKDAGIYKCRIDFKQSPTVTNEVELKIIQESKKPVIIGKSLSFIKMFHNFATRWRWWHFSAFFTY